MKEHILCILRDAQTIQLGTDCTRINELANQIETEAKAALRQAETNNTIYIRLAH